MICVFFVYDRTWYFKVFNHGTDFQANNLHLDDIRNVLFLYNLNKMIIQSKITTKYSFSHIKKFLSFLIFYPFRTFFVHLDFYLFFMAFVLSLSSFFDFFFIIIFLMLLDTTGARLETGRMPFLSELLELQFT